MGSRSRGGHDLGGANMTEADAGSDVKAARPIGSAAMGAFVGFFLGPAVLVATLILSDPERVTYGNTGLVLIASVVAGSVCGAAIGSAARLRAARRPTAARVVAELAGAATGGLLGGAALATNPWLGMPAGAVFGAISGGLLAAGASRRGAAGPDPGPSGDDSPLWDRDLDA